MSIVSTARDTASDAVVEDIARALGIDVLHARRCVGIALPALLAMLCGRGSTAAGASAVFDAARNGRDLGPLLGEDETAVLVRAVGLCAGIDARQSTDLLGTLLPVALDAVGREIAVRGLDKTGLSRLLSAQRGSVGDTLPAGLAEPMQGSRHFDAFMTDFTADVPMTDTAAPDPAMLAEAEYARTVRKPTAMRFGIVAVLVLLAVAWLFYLIDTPNGALPAPAETAREAVPVPTDQAK